MAMKLMLTLLVLMKVVIADITDLTETYCPLCAMIVEKDVKVSFRGNQNVYACSMGGEKKNLEENMGSVMTSIEPVSTFPHPYTPKGFECPVCSMTFWDSAHSITFRNNQKLFACSREHAEAIHSHPQAYFASESNHSTEFCTGKSVMFTGFQSTVGRTCTLVLFQPWILNSELKYAIGLSMIFVLAVFLEYFGEFREHCRHLLLRTFGVSLSSKRYRLSSSLEQDLLTPRIKKKRVPWWCHGVNALLYMIHMTLAFFIMLIVMSYEIGLFSAIIVGLGLGFFLFKDTEGEKMSKNIDPCCST